MGIGRFVLRARPLWKTEKEFFEKNSQLLPPDERKELLKFIKDYTGIPDYAIIRTSIFGDIQIPVLGIGDRERKSEVQELNEKLRVETIKKEFKNIGDNSLEKISGIIAANIIGHEHLKKSCALQLFSDNLHILLLGDPGTGKTEIVRSTAEYSPISSFGLGSGTTNVGMVVTVQGDEIKPGLLPMAHDGICAIDELNLLKEESRAGLYNAMEKGFVTYDKGGHHYQFPANVRILAAANPKGDKFRGASANALRRQLPFDPALLTRFHIVHVIHRPNSEQFERIARKVAETNEKNVYPGDAEIIKTFIEAMRKKEPALTKDVKEAIIMIAKDIKQREEELLIEVSPRLVKGIAELVKASARISQREEATLKDVEIAREIILQSLKA